jgi:ribosomal protein S18 acetylase RimI-like enzyme
VDLAIVRATLPKDARALAAFDKRTFPNVSDHSTPAYFSEDGMQSFWLLLKRRRIGACSLIPHATFEASPHALCCPEPGTLYITSTAIVPTQRGYGFGSIWKAWQITYAKKGGFKKIVTNARVSNTASIALNRKFGFAVVHECIPDCYADGEESIVFELILSPE